MSNVACILKRMKASPSSQREAFHTWSLTDGAEGQWLAIYQSDSLPAKEALRGATDAIFMRMAVAEDTGVAYDPWNEQA